MKVLLLSDGVYPYKIGGMQRHSFILTKLLLLKGVDVHLVHCGGNGMNETPLPSLFDEITGTFTETVIPFPKTDPFPGHYIRENKAYSKSAYEAVQSTFHDVDVIYAQGFTGWAFLQNKESHQIPVLVNFHGLEMYQMAPSLRVKVAYSLFKSTVKWMLKNADYAYSFGGKLDQILQDLGVDESNILQQSNGIELDWVNTDELQINHPRKFLFVGRAERRKGVKELNEALELLLGEDADFEFGFIGPIKQEPGLDDARIHYFGELRKADRIKGIMRDYDCLVCPSHAEGMPTVLLEAMASGMAVITTDVGASSRMVSENGILLPKPDVYHLKRAIKEVIELHPAKLMAMKKRSVELVKDTFTWEKVVQQKIADFNLCVSKSATSN